MSELKVVVVEDDEILSKVICEELADAGFAVTCVHDGAAGLQAVQNVNPDLVLLDLLLPEKNGFEVLKELKESPVTKNIPVTILTMLGADDDIKKGLALGANDYIVKSQHAVAEIIDTVKEFFGKESHPEGKEMGQTPPVEQEADTTTGSQTEINVPDSPQVSQDGENIAPSNGPDTTTNLSQQ